MLYLPPTNLDIIPTLITSRYLQYSNCLLLITSILSTFQFIKAVYLTNGNRYQSFQCLLHIFEADFSLKDL